MLRTVPSPRYGSPKESLILSSYPNWDFHPSGLPELTVSSRLGSISSLLPMKLHLCSTATMPVGQDLYVWRVYLERSLAPLGLLVYPTGKMLQMSIYKIPRVKEAG